MATQLIKNGRLITESRDEICDVLITDGIVKKISSKLTDTADQIIDATGLYIFPGGVDAHTHMELPAMGTFSSDDFKSGTLAAIAGGTTTIIDFANQSRGESLHVTLDKWLEKSKKAECATHFHVSVTDVNERTLQEMQEIKLRGVNSFKTFLAYKGMRLTDEHMSAVMQKATSIGALVTAHCEMGEEVEKNVADFITADRLEPACHPLTRPARLEGEATEHFLALAHKNSCPSYVVHMTCKESVDALRSAKGRGQKCYGETCPQYLILDDSAYQQEFDQACKYILSPPLRAKHNQNPLWDAIADGTIDVVATDHCPFTLEQREKGRDNFTKIPNGIPGVQERMILMYSEGVAKGRISLQRYVELCCTNPAKIFGLYPQKGTLEVGSGGDFFLLDPNKHWKLANEQLQQNVDYSCYEGLQIQGQIVGCWNQ